MDEFAPAPMPSEVLKMLFKFDVATPHKVDVSQHYGPGTPDTTRAELSAARDTRNEMVAAMEGSSDPSKIIAFAGDYLDFAMRMFSTEINNEVEELNITPTTEFNWSSVLDNKPRSGRWVGKDAYVDAGFTFVALATAHVNAAHDAAHGVGEDMKTASAHLRTASGILTAASTSLLSRCAHKLAPSKPHPVELYNATAAGLAAACLAQAQQCFLYIADASGKPKKLLAKLAKAVSDKYIDAMAALRNGLPNSAFTSLDTRTMELIAVMGDVANGLALKYQAQQEYDDGEYGNAIAYAHQALAVLRKVATSKLHDSALQDAVNAEYGIANELVKTYTTENNTIYFSAVPKPSEVPKLMPIFFVKPDPFKPKPEWSEGFEMPAPKAPAAAATPASASTGGAGGGAGAGSDSAAAAGVTETVYVDAKPAAKPTASKKQLKFGCACCAQLMTAPAGSSAIQCPKCSAINRNITCGACDTSVSFAAGNKLVRCPTCQVINRIKA